MFQQLYRGVMWRPLCAPQIPPENSGRGVWEETPVRAELNRTQVISSGSPQSEFPEADFSWTLVR